MIRILSADRSVFELLIVSPSNPDGKSVLVVDMTAIKRIQLAGTRIQMTLSWLKYTRKCHSAVTGAEHVQKHDQ